MINVLIERKSAKSGNRFCQQAEIDDCVGIIYSPYGNFVHGEYDTLVGDGTFVASNGDEFKLIWG